MSANGPQETKVGQPYDRSRRLFRLLSPLTAFVVISFVAGFIIGIKIYSDRSRTAFLNKQKSVVRILTLKNVFSKSVKFTLGERSGWSLDFVEAETPLQLWQRLESANTSPPFDIVILYSYQIPLAFQLGKVQAMDRARIPNFASVHPDFSNLPGDPTLRNVLPLLWGITGIATHASLKTPLASWKSALEMKALKDQIGLPLSATELLRIALLAKDSAAVASLPAPGLALQKLLEPWLKLVTFAKPGESATTLLKTKPLKVLAVSPSELAYPPLKNEPWTFQMPEGGGTFWVLSAALGRDGRSEEGAYAVLNALGAPDIAKAMSAVSHQASVNRWLESDKSLDKTIKPSYLRQLPIGSYVLWMDFSRAREVRDLMLKADQHP